YSGNLACVADRAPRSARGGSQRNRKVAALLGREFSHELVGPVAQRPEAELRTALQRLTAADLLFYRGGAPQTVCWFKHALVQNAGVGHAAARQAAETPCAGCVGAGATVRRRRQTPA